MSLELIRSNNQWLTKVVLFVIAVVFTLGFGYSFVNFGTSGLSSQGSAAQVNGEEISLYEYYRLRDSMTSRFNQNTEIPEAALNFLRVRALNQLIDLKLLYQKAGELGLEITDEELKQSIISNQAFQIDGDFIGFAAYKNFVQQSLKENVGEFERRYKEELLAQKFIDFINETAKINDEELLNLYRIQNERIKLAYIKFSPSDYLDQVEVKDEEISKYFSENKKNYFHAEQREIEYIVIKPGDFEKGIEITDEKIAAYYNSYKDEEFLDTDGNPKELEIVKEDIRSLLTADRKNDNRQEFIGKLDDYSKTKEISEIGKQFAIEKPSTSIFSLTANTDDSIPQVVKNKAFELKKEEKYFTNVSEDIWIVNIKDIKTKRDKNLEDARDDVTADLKVIRAKDIAKKESKKFHKKLLNDKVKISELKTTNNSKYNETEYFSRLDKVEEIDSKEILLDSFLLSDKNQISKEVYQIADDYLILSLIEKKQIDINEFEDKKEDIKNTILQRKKNDIYRDWILSIRKQAEIIPNAKLFPNFG